jgi:alpha-beta hydrolase superfamily lysophospholipase
MPRHEEGFFAAKGNLRLYWESDAPDGEPKAVFGVVHGFGDHLGRYRALKDSLLTQGFAVHAFDFRGHGRSDGKRGHVDAFADYLDDLSRFVERVRAAAATRPIFLVAHSMGALISLMSLSRGAVGFRGAVVTSPYLALNFDPPRVKLLAAKVLDRVLPSLTLGNELKDEQLSRDVAWQKSTRADPLYGRVVSSRWFTESIRAQNEVQKSGGAVKLPLLMLCGAEDPIASTPTSRRFFESIASTDKQYKEYPGMRHEVLNELGKEEVHTDIVHWTSARL